MNILSVDNISKSFGERILFKDVAFGIETGQKIALVGVNGSGKSTLLKIIAGYDVPESGEVVIANDVKLSYVSQDPILDNDSTILDVILDGSEEIPQLIKEYEREIHNPEQSGEKLAYLIDNMDKLNAWNFEIQVKEILGRLGIQEYEKKIDQLSGGQKKRVGLAKALIEKPDLIILDEPTNHLDLDVIEWLEQYLSMNDLALIMVTHDRYFLDSVTNEIIEIDQNTIYKYQGDYSYFLEKKAERSAEMHAQKEKAKNLFKKELDWIRRQPKARGTKAKYRVDAFDDVKKQAHKNLKTDKVELDVTTRRQGGKILELEQITKSFEGTKVVHPFSYIFKKQEKIGIVGKNGSGKSTFLNMLTGQLTPDDGEVVKGQTTVFGYYKQKEPEFKPNQKVIEVVQEIAEVVTLSNGSTVSASQFLNKFNFTPASQYDFVEKLSGGEKRRLQLLTVLVKNPNFLILDEPTNDLDLETLRILEDFLESFQGCVLIVSHDRYFLDKLVDHLFIFEKGQPVEDFLGNYTDYRAELDLKKLESKKEKPEAEKVQKVRLEEKKKMSYKEKREFERLEVELSTLNKKKKSLIEELNSGNADHEELMKLGQQLKETEELIDEKEMRWLELSELQG